MALKPYIQHQFTGQIWKMVIDTEEELLFIETRDVENHIVKFSGFDLSTAQANFTDIETDEKWLTGIEGCYNGVLFLHAYQSAQSPVHQGIAALNGINGNILWSNYTNAIHHISTNGPIVYNTQIQPKKLFLADVHNGAALRPFNASIDEDMPFDIQMPHIIELENNDFSTHIQGDIAGNVHYLEHNGFRIVSLHTLNKANLSQILLVMQGDDLVYKDLLTDKIQKLQPEAFIVQQNRLIYIKNKVELKVLNL